MRDRIQVHENKRSLRGNLISLITEDYWNTDTALPTGQELLIDLQKKLDSNLSFDTTVFLRKNEPHHFQVYFDTESKKQSVIDIEVKPTGTIYGDGESKFV